MSEVVVKRFVCRAALGVLLGVSLVFAQAPQQGALAIEGGTLTVSYTHLTLPTILRV